MADFFPQGSIVYEIDGTYPSQYFFGVNSTTGQVKIIQDLRQDSTKLLTYTVSTFNRNQTIFSPSWCYLKATLHTCRLSYECFSVM